MTIMQKIIKRIPGNLPPPPKTEIDGKIENLSTKSISELLDLRDRQLKLLKNKLFINKLPDKGEKIRAFHDKIVTEIEGKEQIEQTTRLFSDMKIDKNSVQNVEWKGKIEKDENTYLDSDDDSDPEDILHILSQSPAQEKKTVVVKPDKPLITTDDIHDIGETPHVKKIVEKTEHNVKPKVTGHFKPYKTTISDVHNPDKEIHRKKNKHWEVTAATPPPLIHTPAKVLSLEESLYLLKSYNKHLKEIEAEHAAEKLLSRTGIKMSDLLANVSQFGNHRSPDSDDSCSDESDLEGSDKEVVDEEPERGGVVFTVMK